MDYPLPSYAVGMWLVGDEIAVRIPPSDGHDSGHVLRFPATEIGFRGVVSLLKAREAHKGMAKIGTRAAPTQHDLERMAAWAKAMSPDKRSRRDREMDSLLDELGDLI